MRISLFRQLQVLICSQVRPGILEPFGDGPLTIFRVGVFGFSLCKAHRLATVACKVDGRKHTQEFEDRIAY